MTVSIQDQNQIALRRQRIASLRARGLTLDEIWLQLGSPTLPNKPTELNPAYMVNPDTGQPYDRSTIQRDLQANHKAALAAAAQDTRTMQARQLAELDELRRAAWGARKFDIVLRCLEREAKLFGLDAPARLDWTTDGEKIGLTINIGSNAAPSE